MKQEDESLSRSEEDSGDPNDELEWLDLLADDSVEPADHPAVGDQKPEPSGQSDEPVSIDDTIEIKAPDREKTNGDEYDLETQIQQPAPESSLEEGDIDATLVDFQIQKQVEDDVPEWLEDRGPELEEEGESDSDGDDLGWLDRIADSGRDLVGADETLDDKSQATNWDDQNDVPEDPDEAMAWLEQLAAQQGAPIDELPTLHGEGSEDFRPPGEDQLEFSLEGPDEKKTSQEYGETPDVAEEFDRFAAAVESELQRIRQAKDQEQDEEAGRNDREFDEIPEDPDEAMAWLEKLAARQGAQFEELPTLSGEREVDVETFHEYEVSTEEDFGIDELDELALPADDAEALAWLEELADDEPIKMEEEARMVEEPITPVRPWDVESARLEVEELFPGSQSEQVFDSEEGLAAEDEDSLAWMEQLVVERQEIEDAYAIQAMEDESGTEEIEPPDWLVDSGDTTEEAGSEVEDESREVVEELAAVRDEEDQASIELTNALLEEELASDESTEELVSARTSDIEETLSGDADLKATLTDTEQQEELLVFREEDEDVELPEFAQAKMADEPGQEPEETPIRFGQEKQASETMMEFTDSLEEIEIVDEHEPSISELEVEPLTADQFVDRVTMSGETGVGPESDEAEDELEWAAESAEIDAEAWLEAEEAKATVEQPLVLDETDQIPMAYQEEIAPQDESILLEKTTDIPAEEISEEDVLKQPDPELLEKAREAIASGSNAEAVESFDALVRRGHGIPYLIADLELSIEEYGAQIPLQRVLGDAYAQNGQLAKALNTYREALDNL